jgi:hypothetical protein
MSVSKSGFTHGLCIHCSHVNLCMHVYLCSRIFLYTHTQFGSCLARMCSTLSLSALALTQHTTQYTVHHQTDTSQLYVCECVRYIAHALSLSSCFLNTLKTCLLCCCFLMFVTQTPTPPPHTQVSTAEVPESAAHVSASSRVVKDSARTRPPFDLRYGMCVCVYVCALTHVMCVCVVTY